MIGRQVRRNPVQVEPKRAKLPVALGLLGWAARTCWRVFALAAHVPLLTVELVLILESLGRFASGSPVGGTLCGVAFLALTTVLFIPVKGHFALARTRARGEVRQVGIYRRSWQPAMVTAGLVEKLDSRTYLPRLRSCQSTASLDLLRVRMVAGQIVTDWVDASERLAQTFGAQGCRAMSLPGHPHDVRILVIRRDPLGGVVPIHSPLGDWAEAGLAIGQQETSDVYRLQITGTHVLVVGATGAGKGSVLWSIVLQLRDAVRQGTAQIWAFDPKGGMELCGGAALFSRFIYGDLTGSAEGTFADALEEAVVVMGHRQARMRGQNIRKHRPTAEEPLIVLLVDELASLTAWINDRDCKKRISTALSLLLSQGRAVGVVVVAAVQDPRKEAIPCRDLFPTRIGLRMTEAEHVNLALGSGARDRGALCDQIPESLPGVGFVMIDGIPDPARVRFSYVSDDDITEAMPNPLEALTA